MVSVILFSRADYNRLVLGAGFGGVVLWYTLVTLVIRRTERGVFGLLPNVANSNLGEIADCVCQELTDPYAPVPTVDALVIDSSVDLDNSWQKFVTKCRLAGVSVYSEELLRELLTGKVEIDHVSVDDHVKLVSGKKLSRISRILRQDSCNYRLAICRRGFVSSRDCDQT